MVSRRIFFLIGSNYLVVQALADDERKKLEEKEALEEKKREEAERKCESSAIRMWN